MNYRQALRIASFLAMTLHTVVIARNEAIRYEANFILKSQEFYV